MKYLHRNCSKIDESLYFSLKIKNMGFLGEIRKLLFGVKSVTKSGAEKVADKSVEIGGEILDKGADTYQKGKEIAGDVMGKAADKFDDVKDTVGDKLADLKDRAKNILDDAGSSETAQKAGDFTEKVGKKVMEVGGDAAEKAADLSEKVGDKVIKAKDAIMGKAEEIGDKLSDKYDETYEKAKAMEAEEALNPKGEFADTKLDAGGSLLEGSDDFFAKAERFAEGEYHDKDKVVIGDAEITKPEGAKEKEMAKLAGFEDADGDGNDLVDDAIIVEDDQLALPADDGDVTDAVSDQLESAEEKAADLASIASEKAGDAVDSVKEAAGGIMDSVKEKAENVADAAAEKASSVIDSAKDAVSNVKDSAADMAKQASAKIDEVTGDKLDDMEDMMDKMADE